MRFARRLAAVALAAVLVAWAASCGGAGSGPADAPSAQTADAPDEVASPAEREAGRLLERWAPTFVQHVGDDDGVHDRPTTIDFDGDWDTRNNWARAGDASEVLPPAVYGAAVMTETHAYLTYTLYYPRDWTAPICLPYVCHDNDLENVLVVVRRGEPSSLELVETKAHTGYRLLEGRKVARDRGRPVVRVEPQGHGTAACRPSDRRCEPGRERVVYRREARASGDSVRYALVSLRDTLWARRSIDGNALWASGETGPLWYVGTRSGRIGAPLGAAMAGRWFRGGVRPPWALKGPRGARGDWFLDPAAVIVPRLSGRDPGPCAHRYVYHPFLYDLRSECAPGACSEPAPPAPTRSAAWAGLGLVGLGMALSLGHSRRRLSRIARSLRSSGRRHPR